MRGPSAIAAYSPLLLANPKDIPPRPRQRIRHDPGRCIRRDSLKPYLNFVAVRIANEGVRQTRAEFATRSDRTPRVLDRYHGRIDIFRAGKPKPKVNDSAGGARAGRALLKRQDIILPGTQHLNGGRCENILAPQIRIDRFPDDQLS